MSTTEAILNEVFRKLALLQHAKTPGSRKDQATQLLELCKDHFSVLSAYDDRARAELKTNIFGTIFSGLLMALEEECLRKGNSKECTDVVKLLQWVVDKMVEKWGDGRGMEQLLMGRRVEEERLIRLLSNFMGVTAYQPVVHEQCAQVMIDRVFPVWIKGRVSFPLARFCRLLAQAMLETNQSKGSHVVDRINYGKVVNSTLKSCGYRMTIADQDQFFLVCTNWFGCKEITERATSSVDFELLSALLGVLREDGRQCLPLLRQYGQLLTTRFMKLYDENSSIRFLALDVIHEIGQSMISFAAVQGFDTIPNADLRWFKIRDFPDWLISPSRPDQIYPLHSDLSLSFEKCATQLREMDKANPSSTFLFEEPPLNSSSFARCAASIVRWRDRIEQDKFTATEALINAATSPTYSSEENSKATQSRVSHLIVFVEFLHGVSDYELNHVDFGPIATRLCLFVLARVGDILSYESSRKIAEIPAMRTFEMFLFIKILGLLANLKVDAESKSWQDLLACLAFDVLPVTTKMRHFMMFHVWASDALASVCVLCPPVLVEEAMDKLWAARFFQHPARASLRSSSLWSSMDSALPSTESIYSLALPSEMRIGLCVPLHCIAFVVSAAPSLITKPLSRPGDSSMQSIRARLLLWALDWIVASVPSSLQIETKFSHAVVSLLGVPIPGLSMKEEDVGVAFAVERRSRLYIPNPMVELLPIPTHVSQDDALHVITMFDMAAKSLNQDLQSFVRFLTFVSLVREGTLGKIDFENCMTQTLELIASMALTSVSGKDDVNLWGKFVSTVDRLMNPFETSEFWALERLAPIKHGLKQIAVVRLQEILRIAFTDQDDDVATVRTSKKESSAKRTKLTMSEDDFDNFDGDLLFDEPARSSKAKPVVPRTADLLSLPVSSHSQSSQSFFDFATSSSSQPEAQRGGLVKGLNAKHCVVLFWACTPWIEHPMTDLNLIVTRALSENNASMQSRLLGNLVEGFCLGCMKYLARNSKELLDQGLVASFTLAGTAWADYTTLTLGISLSRNLLKHATLGSLRGRCGDDFSPSVINLFLGNNFFFHVDDNDDIFIRYEPVIDDDVVDIVELYANETSKMSFLGWDNSIAVLDIVELSICVFSNVKISNSKVFAQNFGERMIAGSLRHDDCRVRDAASRSIYAIVPNVANPIEILHEVCSFAPVPWTFGKEIPVVLHDADDTADPCNIKSKSKMILQPDVTQAARLFDTARTHLIAMCTLGLCAERLFRCVLHRLCLAAGLLDSDKHGKRRSLRSIMHIYACRAGFESPFDLLRSHADYLWDHFLLDMPLGPGESGVALATTSTSLLREAQFMNTDEHRDVPSIYQKFPHDLFGLDKNADLLSLTVSDLLPRVLLHKGSRNIEKLLVDLARLVLGNEREVNNLILEYRGSAIGVIRPILYLGAERCGEKGSNVDEWIASSITRALRATKRVDDVAQTLNSNDFLNAVCRALNLLCDDGVGFGATRFVDDKAVTLFVRQAVSNDEKSGSLLLLDQVTPVDVVIHLARLAHGARNHKNKMLKVIRTIKLAYTWFASRMASMFDFQRVWTFLVLDVIGQSGKACDTAVFPVACELLLHELKHVEVWPGQGARQSFVGALGAVIESTLKSVPEALNIVRSYIEAQELLKRLKVCEEEYFAVKENDSPLELASKRLMQEMHNVVKSCARKIVSGNNRDVPGVSEPSVGFLLSISPNLLIPRCLKALDALRVTLDESWDVVQNAIRPVDQYEEDLFRSLNEPPPEIVNALRPDWPVVVVLNTATPPFVSPPLAKSQSSESGVAVNLQRAIEICTTSVIECLIRLSGVDSPSDDVQALAGRCLCKIVGSRADSLVSSPTPEDTATIVTDDPDLFSMRANVLRWLFEMLANQDFNLASCASCALKSSLQLKPMQVAIDLVKDNIVRKSLLERSCRWLDLPRLSSGCNDFGEPFELMASSAVQMARNQCRASSVVSTMAGTSNTTKIDALSPEVWNPESRSFNEWIRAVTDAMCHDKSVVRDRVFLLFGPVSVMEHRFAIMLFPWLIENCLNSENTEQAVAQLSQRFVEVFLNKSAPRALHRLLLNTLSFLRGRKIKKTVREDLQRGPSAPTRSSKHRAAVTSKDDYRSFGLNVDYLLVAEVALDCAMPATAVVSVEIWLDLRRSNRTREENTYAASFGLIRPQHEDILLKAFRMMGNRDAAAGVKRTVALNDRVLERGFEGDWLGAAIGYDQLLQRQGMFGPDSNSAGLVYGEVSSITRLGLVHAMCEILTPAVSAASSRAVSTAQKRLKTHNTNMDSNRDVDFTRDLRFESAWRSIAHGIDVDLKRLVVPHLMEKQNISIHEVLCHSYEAISDGDEILLSRVCRLGGKRFLENLTLTENQEVFDLNISRLTLCHELEEVLKVIQKHLPSSSTSLETEIVNCFDRWNRVSLRRGTQSEEELFTARECMLRAFIKVRQISGQPVDEQSLLGCHLVYSAESARLRGETYIAAGTIDRLRHTSTLTTSTGIDGGSLAIVETYNRNVKLACQDAMVCWSGGDRDTALSLVRSLATEEVCARLPALRCLVGWWYAENASVSSSDLGEDWFAKALATYEKRAMISSSSTKASEMRMLGQCYSAIGVFVDRRFRSVDSRIASPEWKETVLLHEHRNARRETCKSELAEMKVEKKASEDEMRQKKSALALLERTCYNHRTERQALESTHSDLLMSAFENLCLALYFGVSSIVERDTIYRVIHLWFTHRLKHPALDEMASLFFSDAVVPTDQAAAMSRARGSSVGVARKRTVASSKLLPLVYQISSRVGSSDVPADSPFLRTIEEITTRLCRDHPWHTLPNVLAVVNSQRGLGPGQNLKAEGNFRIAAAKRILHQVRGSSTKLESACDGFGSLCNAFIALAAQTTPRTTASQNNALPFSTDTCAEFVTAKSAIPWNFLPMPVYAVPVRHDCNYFDDQESFPRLARIETGYSVTDQGIHVPKKIRMVGSDGIQRIILLKSKDDLRQDYVMEQLLGFASELLAQSNVDVANDSNGKSRRVHGRATRLRTYQVLPLTPVAGLIEWVENTTSLGSYLTGGFDAESSSRSAHVRHNPSDVLFMEALNEMRPPKKSDKISSSSLSKKQKLDVFQSILTRFHPVFRHFFFERFGSDPKNWHEKRLAYTRSTAANAMVGMILGIGDRHSQNILIDKCTAEIIHIDFGFTFEQGKTLPTPETVPFRLTQDVIDGFGVAGTAGVFTLSCIETLSVLRQNAGAILTICEVFVHDPLHQWTVSAAKQKKIEERGEAQAEMYPSVQQSNAPNSMVLGANLPAPVGDGEDLRSRNLDANLVLSRIREKLQGHVEGGALLDVSAQVKRAIDEATDPANLSELYYGWAAFL